MSLIHYENWGVFDTFVDLAYKGYAPMPLPSITDLIYSTDDDGLPELTNLGQGRNGIGKSIRVPQTVVSVRPTADLNNNNAIAVNRGCGMFITHPTQNTNQTRIIGLWFRIQNFSNSLAILSLGNATRTSIVVRLHTDGHLYFYGANGQFRNDLYVNSGYTYNTNKRVLNYFDSARPLTNFGNTTGLFYPPIIPFQWHYLEIKLRSANAGNGLLHVNLDGAPILRVNAADTNGNNAIGTHDRILLSNYRWTTDYGAGSSAPSYGTFSGPFAYGRIVDLDWDSITVMDTAGTVLNDFIGPATLYSLKPTSTVANGQLSENAFTAVGAATTHAAVQTIQNGASFINGATPGNITFGYEDLPVQIDNEKIHAVMITTYAKRTGAGAKNLQHTISNVNAGGTKSLENYFTPHQDVMPTNPVTGLPWTPAEINALNVKSRVDLVP